MKRVAVLGATGSVGRSALDVCARFPEELRVVSLAAGRDDEGLADLCARFAPARAALADEQAAARLRARVGASTEVLGGPGALAALAADPEVDVVLAAVVGFAGLDSTLAALGAGKRVALANKEALVVAGEICTRTAAARGATLLPVDSEHAGMAQALAGQRREDVARLIVTGSGGPLRARPAAELASVTVEEALRHPTWRMGPKITVDSATLMNKALEVIEAHWLFDVEPARVDVVIHPQSVVHALVELRDGSTLAQLAGADMRGPIAWALGHPARLPLGLAPLDLVKIGALTFEAPDDARFPCVRLGHAALAAGGTAPAVLSGANEVAVAAFLDGRLRFTDIAAVLCDTLATIAPEPAMEIGAVREADRRAREVAGARVRSRQR